VNPAIGRGPRVGDVDIDGHVRGPGIPERNVADAPDDLARADGGRECRCGDGRADTLSTNGLEHGPPGPLYGSTVNSRCDGIDEARRASVL
jgi:hypothetical protein